MQTPSAPIFFESESMYHANNGFSPRGNTVFSSDVEAMLDRAEEVAHEVLNDRPTGHADRDYRHQCGGVQVIHHHHDYWYGSWYSHMFWPSHHTTVIHTAPRSERARDRDDRALIGFAFAVIGGVTAYFLGQDMGLSKEAKEEQTQVGLEKKRFSEFKESAYNHPHVKTIRKIQDTEQRIFENIQAEADSGVRLKVGLLGSAAIGFLGCVIGGPVGWAAISAATLGTAVSGAAMLIRSGNKSAARRNESEARKLLSDVRSMKQLQDGHQLYIIEQSAS